MRHHKVLRFLGGCLLDAEINTSLWPCWTRGECDTGNVRKALRCFMESMLSYHLYLTAMNQQQACVTRDIWCTVISCRVNYATLSDAFNIFLAKRFHWAGDGTLLILQRIKRCEVDYFEIDAFGGSPLWSSRRFRNARQSHRFGWYWL